MLQSALYAVGITLPGVQSARMRLVGVLIYIQIVIELMALKSPILVTWPAGR